MSTKRGMMGDGWWMKDAGVKLHPGVLKYTRVKTGDIKHTQEEP
jgi:hypothetical protein